jgi:hypothetical protein
MSCISVKLAPLVRNIFSISAFICCVQQRGLRGDRHYGDTGVCGAANVSSICTPDILLFTYLAATTCDNLCCGVVDELQYTKPRVYAFQVVLIFNLFVDGCAVRLDLSDLKRNLSIARAKLTGEKRGQWVPL